MSSDLNGNQYESIEKPATAGAACFRCRGFRHACDRTKPSCLRCQRRGINCVYPEAAPTLKRLQKATENLGERIKKFNEKLRTSEMFPQQQNQQNITDGLLYSMNDTIPMNAADDIPIFMDDVGLSIWEQQLQQQRPKRRIIRRGKVASTSNYSVYPCTKCFKDLQQCDLTLPRCSRCAANHFECGYKKAEPKANHVSQVLTTMNKIMDQWQESIDRVAKDFAQKTRDLSVKANNSLKMKPTPQTAWKITSTKRGLSVESNVNTYNDLSRLIEQFKRTMSITPKDNKSQQNKPNTLAANINQQHLSIELKDPLIEFEDTSSIHTTTGFAIWDTWACSSQTIPQNYPIDINQELTDNLIDLYCRTPCCSSIRLPIIDTETFLKRYQDPDPTKRPPTVLVYAICAMAARNAFQLHVWSKKPTSESPNYNMGKALSVAYCLRGRELLSECFDEPTFDHCQAAFLLSYCNYQNGFTNVIYFYEWIAFNMAQELGLYKESKKLTRYESMLVWCLYDCNAWYKALRGGDGAGSRGISQCRPPMSTLPSAVACPNANDPESAWVEYYVWNSWVYQIQLQLLRDQTITLLVTHEGQCDSILPQELLALQQKLEQFYNELPLEWKPSTSSLYENLLDTDSPSYCSFNVPSPCCSFSSASSKEDSERNDTYHVDMKTFSRHCIQLVNLHFYINQIILYQPFVPMHRVPFTHLSLKSLQVSVNAATQMTNTFRHIIQHQKACYVPLVGFIFANVVYRKLLSYTTDDHYYEVGKLGVLQSIELSKLSNTYSYDFEMARTLVGVMEQDTQYVAEANMTNSNPYMMLIDAASSALSTQTPQTPLTQQNVYEIQGKPEETCPNRY